MRQLLPLCALIVIASGCVAVRHDSDANFLPPVAADHSEIISDEACVEYCQQAIEADEEFCYPYWLVAKSYSELAKWDEAVLYWTDVAERFSFDEKLHAEALRELQKAREALAGGGE